MASIKERKTILVASISVLALVLALFAIREARKPDPIPNYQISERSTATTIVIPEGASGNQIAEILFNGGVVKSSRAFFAAATANTRSQSIQPGTYRIDTKIPGSEAVNQLLDRQRRLMVFLIREGERAYELRDDLRDLKFDESEINQALEEKVSIPGFGMREIEGFLFPATYNLFPGESVESVRNRALTKFNAVMKKLDFLERVKRSNLDPYEALTIASIVQGEGFDERDFGKVARVIFNRLSINMPLQMDSTVLYALRERRIDVSTRDISISSEYNTYNRRGLPPTPIGNPGQKALEATLNPEPGEWLYFVTVAPTETKFTKSYQEFLSFKAEFKRNLKAGLFNE